jgi:UDP-glucose 4-epimerase
MTGMQRLAGKRVLITGGAGLIASHMVDLLRDTGAAEIVLVDDLSRGRLANLTGSVDGAPPPDVTFVEGDIGDRALLARHMEGIDVLLHMAALRLTLCAEHPRRAIEVMVDGTYDVLEAAMNASVPRVVAASSASIYGDADTFPITEDHHPYNDRTIYGAAKSFTEGLLRSFNEMYALPYVAMRYFNVYGPRMDIHGAYTEVLVRWMDRIAGGRPPIIFGDGKDSMDFVYVGDIARANLLAAASDVSDEVFNVASGVETDLVGLATALLEVMGSDLPIEHGPARALTRVSRRLADPSKAKELLGFEAEVDLHEGLTRLVDWWQVARHEPASAVGGREARS